MTPPTARHGFTMYEVVLSLAILLGALAVLGQLIATGSRAATQSHLRTEAMLRCQTQMAEVIASAANGTLIPIDNDVLETNATGSWTWSLQVADGRTQGGGMSTASGSLTAATTGIASTLPHADLMRLDVTVSRVAPDQSIEATATLTRFIRTPELYIEAAEQAAELAAETAE